MAGTKTLEQGQRIIRKMTQAIESPEGLAHQYAAAVLEIARHTAASKPTPQARMVASQLKVDGDTIRLLAGGAPAGVAIGAEFGSDIYLQFHKPSNRKGYWLYPAMESPGVLAAGDQALEAVIRQVTNG